MTDMENVTVVIAGIGGYGNTVLKNMLPNLSAWGITLVGAVDPAWEKAPLWPELEAMGVPHFDSLEEFYKTQKADLAILCTPIHFHEANALTAMENGSDVLCEKPVAATLPEAERMAAAAKRLARQLHIGFQLSYIPAVWALKQDIMAGVLGAPRHLRSLVCWPRGSEYYARPWCAKIKKNGRYVLDSIAMNACAHYLHILYFLLGDTMATSAQPKSVEGITCRANDIETFDTAMLRMQAKGASLDFLVTHACGVKTDVTIVMEFENAVVELTEVGEENGIRATFRDGTEKLYGDIRSHFFDKIPYCCDVVRGLQKPVCTVETALPHLKTVDAVTEKIPVVTLSGSKNEKNVTVVAGLDSVLKKAFAENKMPWELTDRFGAPTYVELADYVWRDTL